MSTALVLGASGTLGSAIARELLARGQQLGLHYNTRREVCEGIASGNAAVKLYQADFSSADAAQNLCSAFLKNFQRIDALIWAAGIVRDAPLLTLKDEDLRAQLNIDLKAFFLVLKSLSKQFIKQKSGAVVALSSHAALSGRAGGCAYAMAHAGMLALIKSAAREWGPLGVRVNAVLPPFVPQSGMGQSASPEFAKAVEDRCALKTNAGGAAAVAKFVAELIEQRNISGQVLSVDSRITV